MRLLRRSGWGEQVLAPLLSCPCMLDAGAAILRHVLWPPCSRGIERVEGLREDLDAAISQAASCCLTQTDLPYRPRTVVSKVSCALPSSPLQCAGCRCNCCTRRHCPHPA